MNLNIEQGTMKRLPSFTLLELVVVLALTSIVTAIGYEAYRLTGRQMIFFSSSSRRAVEAGWLYATMQRDFLNARLIRRSNDGVKLSFADRTEISYEFHPGGIVRSINGITDTFNVEVRSVRMYMSKKEQPSDGAVIEEIEAAIHLPHSSYKLYLKKNYGADILMSLPD